MLVSYYESIVLFSMIRSNLDETLEVVGFFFVFFFVRCCGYLNIFSEVVF